MTSTTNTVDHGTGPEPASTNGGHQTDDTPVVAPRADQVDGGNSVEAGDVGNLPTRTEPATIRHEVPEWRRPAWATSVCYDGTQVSFSRGSRTTFVEEWFAEGNSPTSVEVSRTDRVIADGEQGTVSIVEGQVYVLLNVEELTVPEARKMVAALVEVLDAVDNPAAASSAVVL